jgi:hypothetical protein
MPLHRRLTAALVAALCLTALPAAPALAQFTTPPAPLPAPEQATSAAESPKAYRVDAARHLYLSYPMQVLRGKLPPLLYAIAVVETTLDATGQVLRVEITREPAVAKEVMPWLVQMIRRAAPYPQPQKLGEVIYTDIWLVDKSGRFQLDTLTEGQRSNPSGD